MEAARQQVAAAIHADARRDLFYRLRDRIQQCRAASRSAIIFIPKRKRSFPLPIEHPSVLQHAGVLENPGNRRRLLPRWTATAACCWTELEKMHRQRHLPGLLHAGQQRDRHHPGYPRPSRKIAARHDVRVLSDCVQALGKVPIDVHGWGIDYASFSAHKLYGPKGVGALYVKQGSPFAPFLHGGHQESGMRAGTESMHNIAGFGAACQDVDKLLAHTEQVRALKEPAGPAAQGDQGRTAWSTRRQRVAWRTPPASRSRTRARPDDGDFWMITASRSRPPRPAAPRKTSLRLS